MSQRRRVSLTIDKNLIDKVEEDAKLNGISLSRQVELCLYALRHDYVNLGEKNWSYSVKTAKEGEICKRI